MPYICCREAPPLSPTERGRWYGSGCWPAFTRLVLHKATSSALNRPLGCDSCELAVSLAGTCRPGPIAGTGPITLTHSCGPSSISDSSPPSPRSTSTWSCSCTQASRSTSSSANKGVSTIWSCEGLPWLAATVSLQSRLFSSEWCTFLSLVRSGHLQVQWCTLHHPPWVPSSIDKPLGSTGPGFYGGPLPHNCGGIQADPPPVVHLWPADHDGLYTYQPWPAIVHVHLQRPPGASFGAPGPNHAHYPLLAGVSPQQEANGQSWRLPCGLMRSAIITEHHLAKTNHPNLFPGHWQSTQQIM